VRLQRGCVIESWKNQVAHLAADASFSEPASVEAIAAVEGGLGLALPTELKTFCLKATGSSRITALMLCGPP
jgi:cell wall assembly regulator SMI1